MQLSALDLNSLYRSSDYIMVLDTRLVITHWNLALGRKMMIAEPDAVGHTLPELLEELEGDYRIQCMEETARKGASFFFPDMSFHYSTGHYTQLILPLYQAQTLCGVLNITREHPPGATVTQPDLLLPLQKSAAAPGA